MVRTANTNDADEELVKKRRLGQTNLAVKPGQVGTSNATKPENLGIFDYAHLRAPLPKNLKGSEIFAPNQHQPHPEAYFLMVRWRLRLRDCERCADGCVMSREEVVTAILAPLACSRPLSPGQNTKKRWLSVTT